MRNINFKKLILPNIPYVFIALLATKISEAVRLAPGADASAKLLHIMDGLHTAFQSAAPSFHPIDLCVGIAAAIAIRLAVYIKGKNAKKFRKNLEYGSARWGTAEDIKPYVDPVFENNIILTQTERLTMSSRPKDPKTARNKNVLIVGGSGSGKTRFWLKPNLLQCSSKTYPTSFVVTDPKGDIVVSCGHVLQKNGYQIKILNSLNFKKSINREEVSATQTDEALYLVDGSVYLHVQHTDGGWDYSLYDKESKKLLDGGVIDSSAIEDSPVASVAGAVRTEVFAIQGMTPTKVTFADMKTLEDLQEAQITPPLDSEQITGAVAVPTDAADNMLPELEQAVPMPDPTLTVDDMRSYGYLDGDMLPLSKDRAVELLEHDITVYMLYPDNAEEMVFEAEDIIKHDGMFGVTRPDWDAVKGHIPPRDVEQRFLNSPTDSIQKTGRVRGEDDVIAYHLRQSFVPGEITPEEANRLGCELAKRFTKGNHAYIVCTHIDKAHIHNHVIWNSTALSQTRKFRNFWGSSRAVRRLNDTICIENGYSIVENPKRHGKSYNKWLGDKKKPSHRERICTAIDDALTQKPDSFETLLELLRQAGYEVKGKKVPSLLGGEQKKSIRMDTLGNGYTPADLRAVIAGEKAHTPRKNAAAPVKPEKRSGDLLVDIQAKLRAGKGAGYARWATLFNLKQMAQTVAYLQDHELLDYAVLSEQAAEASAHFNELSARIKAAETRMAEIAVLREHIVNYRADRRTNQAGAISAGRVVGNLTYQRTAWAKAVVLP